MRESDSDRHEAPVTTPHRRPVKDPGYDLSMLGRGEVDGVQRYRCVSERMVMVPTGAPPGGPGAMGPAYYTCNYEFLGPSLSRGPNQGNRDALCACGLFAVGVCRHCSKPLCQNHLSLLNGKVVCAACAQPEAIEAHTQREEVAKRAGIEQERAQLEEERAKAAAESAKAAAALQAELRWLERETRREAARSLPAMTQTELSELLRSTEEPSDEFGVHVWRGKRFPELTLRETTLLLTRAGYTARNINLVRYHPYTNRGGQRTADTEEAARALDDGRPHKGWIVDFISIARSPRFQWIVLTDVGVLTTAVTSRKGLEEDWAKLIGRTPLWEPTSAHLLRARRLHRLLASGKSLPDLPPLDF